MPIVVALDSSKSEYEIKDVPEDMGLSFALPIVEFPDGNRMSQLPMILDVMGEKLGLHGDSLEEKLAVKQILLDLDDLLTETFNGKVREWHLHFARIVLQL